MHTDFNFYLPVIYLLLEIFHVSEVYAYEVYEFFFFKRRYILSTYIGIPPQKFREYYFLLVRTKELLVNESRKIISSFKVESNNINGLGKMYFLKDL